MKTYIKWKIKKITQGLVTLERYDATRGLAAQLTPLIPNALFSCFVVLEMHNMGCRIDMLC